MDCCFRGAISKQSFPNIRLFHYYLDIYFIWNFKFIYLTLIHFKITISKKITSLFLKQVFYNDHLKMVIQTDHKSEWVKMPLATPTGWKIKLMACLLGVVWITISDTPFQNCYFEIIILKLSFVLDIYFIWKFEFLHSTLVYFKMIISKNITSQFSKRPFQNDNPNKLESYRW